MDGVNGFLARWMDNNEFASRVEQLLLDKALARQMGEERPRNRNEPVRCGLLDLMPGTFAEEDTSRKDNQRPTHEKTRSHPGWSGIVGGAAPAKAGWPNNTVPVS